MENLTKTQFILLVLLVSFVTSLVTGIVVISLISQNPPTVRETIQRVVERKSEEDSTPVLEPEFITQEDIVVKLVQNISPAVVSVVASKDVPVIEEFFINPFGEGSPFGDFQIPQFRQRGVERKVVSSGSGFFVSSDGMIITNRHVVEDASADYEIIMNDGRRVKVEVLALDPVQDIALLKAEGEGFTFIPLGDSNDVKVGQTVVAIGNALGEFQNTVSVGVISGLRRTIVAAGALSGPERLSQVIQTDAAINRGNSGGPLLDLKGRVIGISTAVAQEAENVGFALPINIAKKGIEDVKKSGRIIYPFLGVRYVIVTPALKEEKGLPVDYGALIVGSETQAAVIPNSSAAKAGIREGDIILEFDGQGVNPSSLLGDLILSRGVGDVVRLKILRDGKEIGLEATLEERK